MRGALTANQVQDLKNDFDLPLGEAAHAIATALVRMVVAQLHAHDGGQPIATTLEPPARRGPRPSTPALGTSRAEIQRPYKGASMDERFWSRVTKTDGCWLWNGTTKGGYGVLLSKRRTVTAHRYAYEQLVGPVPPGLSLLHLCNTRICVKPDHLRPGTTAESCRANAAKGRCPKGERCHKARLTEDHVRFIRRSTEGVSALARRFDVCLGTIYGVRNGRTWKHVV